MPSDLPTEFHPKYKGGHWAARIDTQDQVATIVAVEALAGRVEGVPADVIRLGGRLAFEAREDFEVRWNDGRQFVSVKDRQLLRRQLLDAVGTLSRLELEVGNGESFTFRLEAAGVASDARTLYEDIERVRAIRRDGALKDIESIEADFQREHNLDPQVACRVYLTERRIGESPATAAAIFAHAMRNAVIVHNYGDAELVTLFNNLCRSVMHERRRMRGVLDLTDLEGILLTPLVPLHLAAYQVEYVRTRFGYVRDPERQVLVESEQRIVGKCILRLMREWRRKTFLDRLKDVLYRGHIGCLACGHPMIANYNGRNGLACSRCGYQPYLTLFYACDCGEPVVIQRQPDLASLELFRDAVHVLRDSNVRCEGCGARPTNEKFVARLFPLSIPYPIHEYPGPQLIDWRVKLGWKGRGKFERSDRASPPEALLQTRDEQPENY